MEVRKLLAVKSAAEMLDVSRAKFYGMVKSGCIPKPIKIGSSSRWLASDISLTLEKLISERDSKK